MPSEPPNPFPATSFLPLTASNLGSALFFLACAASAALSYALFRPKLAFSKRFSGGRVLLRFENRASAAAGVAIKDFVPEDAVFLQTTPLSIDDTILGRLAEWRAAEMPANSFLEIGYSCSAPLPKQASVEFSHEGKRFRLESS